MNSQLKPTGDSGSTLVSVLVALGLLGIVGGLYFAGSVRSMKAQKTVESKARSNSVESALTNEMVAILRQLTKASCLNSDTIKSRPFGYESTSAALEFTSSVKLVNSNAPHLTAAQKRCAKPVFTTGSGSHLYFCLQFTPSTAGTFAEIAIDFENTNTSTPASCQKFLEDRSTVARISYGIYFSDKESTRKYGVAIAKSEVSP